MYKKFSHFLDIFISLADQTLSISELVSTWLRLSTECRLDQRKVSWRRNHETSRRTFLEQEKMIKLCKTLKASASKVTVMSRHAEPT